MTQTTSLSYRDAGVDIDAGDVLVERIKPLAKKTLRDGVLGGIGMGLGYAAATPAARRITRRGRSSGGAAGMRRVAGDRSFMGAIVAAPTGPAG